MLLATITQLLWKRRKVVDTDLQSSRSSFKVLSGLLCIIKKPANNTAYSADCPKCLHLTAIRRTILCRKVIKSTFRRKFFPVVYQSSKLHLKLALWFYGLIYRWFNALPVRLGVMHIWRFRASLSSLCFILQCCMLHELNALVSHIWQIHRLILSHLTVHKNVKKSLVLCWSVFMILMQLRLILWKLPHLVWQNSLFSGHSLGQH